MFRNYTLLSLAIALLSLVVAPAVFAMDGASATDSSLEAPATAASSKAVAAGDSASLVDRFLGFVIGVFKSAWDGGGDSAGATERPNERGPSFDPHNRA